MEEKTLRVEGMSCGHCKAAVEKAAQAVEGVLRAEVELTAGKLVIQYDGQVQTVNKVMVAIEEIGFEVTKV